MLFLYFILVLTKYHRECLPGCFAAPNDWPACWLSGWSLGFFTVGLMYIFFLFFFFWLALLANWWVDCFCNRNCRDSIIVCEVSKFNRLLLWVCYHHTNNSLQSESIIIIKLMVRMNISLNWLNYLWYLKMWILKCV